MARRARCEPQSGSSAFSICALAFLKLRNVETFSTIFLNYDLLARRWVRYAYIFHSKKISRGRRNTATAEALFIQPYWRSAVPFGEEGRGNAEAARVLT